MRFAHLLKPLMACWSLVILSALAHADTVEIKGGDHLTGTVVKLEDGKLVFKTTYAADPLTIAFDHVLKLTLDKPMILSTAKNKLTVSGFSAADKQLEIVTATGTTMLAVAEVKTLRSTADELAIQKALKPNWKHGWTVNANMSFALAQGNAQTESIGAGSNAVRATRNDKTTINFSTLYGRDNRSDVTISDTTGGSLRYDRNINPKLFAYGSSDFLTNGLQNLDLRSILSSGFGWHAVKDKQQTLDVFGGGTWTREQYSASTTTAATLNSFAALNMGETWNRKLGKPSALTEQTTFYPNMNQLGEYEVQFAAGLTSKLTKLFSWHLNLTDTYTSFPPVGTEKNDMVFTTGIGVTFSRP